MADETPPPAAPQAAPQAAAPMDIPPPILPKQSFVQRLLSPPLVFVVIAIIAMASAGGTLLFLGHKDQGDVIDAGEAQAGEAHAAEEKKPEGEKKEEKKAEEAPKVEGEAAKAEGAQGTDNVDGFPVKLEGQVYNIMEKNSIHYLKLKIEAVCSTAECPDELKSKDSQLKDKILYIISDASLRDLMSTGGKTLLKEDIQNAINKMLKKGMVKQLYFTEFTIQ